MTEEAWAAGFIDGEGCLGLYATGRARNFVPVVRAAGVDPAPLHRLCELFGGKVNPMPTPKSSKWRQAYEWSLHGAREIESALQTLIPYMSVKHSEAMILLMALKTYPQKHGARIPVNIQEFRQECAAALKSLKRIQH